MAGSPRNGPAGERGVGPHRTGRQHVGDPPSVVAFDIDQFNGGVDHFKFERHRLGGGKRHGRQPRGKHIFERAAASADLHEGLAANEPHGTQILRIQQQLRQTAIDHDARHRHQRPSTTVTEHDIAVFDAAPPPPGGCAAGHPAVDTCEDSLQRPVPQVREHDHRGRHPQDRSQHGQRRQREEGPPPPWPRSPFTCRSGMSRRHSGKV